MLKHITGELGWAFGKLGGIIQSVANGGVLGILEAGVSTIAIKTIEKFRKAHEVTRKARKVSIHARLATGDRDNLCNYRHPKAFTHLWTVDMIA